MDNTEPFLKKWFNHLIQMQAIFDFEKIVKPLALR